jgi:malate synthase
LRFTASQIDAIRTMEDLAAGNVSESQLAEWIRANADG